MGRPAQRAFLVLWLAEDAARELPNFLLEALPTGHSKAGGFGYQRPGPDRRLAKDDERR